ncbi:MAG TPA: MaoC family dehydratase N-terminal domain-containing protein [Actinomycetota bacterium]|nr:MaoC family dehydratase N-terminal domain-containing protein [Actinomycetota bacterium]
MAEDVIEFDLSVQRDDIRDFALAVGEDNSVFLDAERAHLQGFPELIAPPTFTVRQIFEVPREERESRLGANLNYARVLHGEQEFSYKRLPVAGEKLHGIMRISKDFVKEGKRGGQMRFVTYETRYEDANGEEVLTAYYTLIETSKDAAS